MNKKRSSYFWTRKLHLYLGLFIGPHVLISALSTLYLNHGWRPGAGGRKRTSLPNHFCGPSIICASFVVVFQLRIVMLL
jgi:hypothetical protein